MENESMEFALLAWRDEGKWRVSQLSDEATSDIGIVLDALRAQQVDGGAIAMLSVDDQFFILIRQIGARMQMVLPVLGCATIRPRCPLPIGVNRSMILLPKSRPVALVSRLNFCVGKSGVR